MVAGHSVVTSSDAGTFALTKGETSLIVTGAWDGCRALSRPEGEPCCWTGDEGQGPSAAQTTKGGTGTRRALRVTALTVVVRL